MIKKKLNILLLLLLVVLFISLLGTTSYARELTLNDVKNFCVNYYKFQYGENADTTNLINNLNTTTTESFLQSWVNSANNSQGRYILSGVNGFVLYWIYDGNATNLNKYGPYYSSYNIYVNTSYLTRWRQRYSVYDYSTEGWSGYDTQVGLNNIYFFYTDTNIYTNGTIANGSIKYNAGYMTPSNIFDGPYKDDYFDIDINADFRNNKGTIKGDTSGTEYYLIPYNSSKIRIGNMFDYSNLEGVVKRKFRYKESIRDFELIQEFESDTNNLEYYSIAEDTLVVYEYYQAETIEFITFIPKADTGFSEFTVPIYYITDNTSITNGVIDNVVTFSGDYYNNYNNDTNTDKVIDNINDNENVDNIINEQLSGDVNDFAAKVGYNPIQNPFIHVIEFLLNGICNTILGSGEVTLDFSFRGVSWVMSSEDLTTPTNILTTFMSVLLSALYIFAFYKYGFHVYEKLQEGDITSVINSSHDDNNWRYM